MCHTYGVIPYPFFKGTYFSILQILAIKLGIPNKGVGYDPVGTALNFMRSRR